MGEIQHQPANLDTEPQKAKMFSTPPKEPARRGLVFGVVLAGLVLLLASFFALRGRTKAGVSPANAILPADAYARNLVLSELAMSQSSSLAGATSTFLDGRVRNGGPSLVTGVTVQVLFRNDEGLSPEVETLPLSLIRTHEPYVDTEPISVAPLKPGDGQEFRLIFETIPANWNQQMPEVHIVKVSTR